MKLRFTLTIPICLLILGLPTIYAQTGLVSEPVKNCSSTLYSLVSTNIRYEDIILDSLEASPNKELGVDYPYLNCSNPEKINQSISDLIQFAKHYNKSIAYLHPEYYERPSDFCSNIWLRVPNMTVILAPSKGHTEFRVPINGCTPQVLMSQYLSFIEQFEYRMLSTVFSGRDYPIALVGVSNQEIENMTQFKQDLENRGYVLKYNDVELDTFLAYPKTRPNFGRNDYVPLYYVTNTDELSSRGDYEYVKNFIVLAKENEVIIRQLESLNQNLSTTHNRLNEIDTNVSRLLRGKNNVTEDIRPSLENNLDLLLSLKIEDTDFSQVENFLSLQEYELRGSNLHQKVFSDYFYNELTTQRKTIERLIYAFRSDKERFEGDRTRLEDKIDYSHRFLIDKEERDIQLQRFNQSMMEARKQTELTRDALYATILGTFIIFFCSNTLDNSKKNVTTWLRAFISWVKKKLAIVWRYITFWDR